MIKRGAQVYEVEHTTAQRDTISVREVIGVIDARLVDRYAVAAPQIANVETVRPRRYLGVTPRDDRVRQFNVHALIASDDYVFAFF